MILRSNFKSRSDADIKSAVEHGKRVKVYPLGGDPDRPSSWTPTTSPSTRRSLRRDLLELLHRFVQVEPWLTRDKAMIDVLKTIGIEKGKPFKPDEKTKAIFDQAGTRSARQEIDLLYAELFAPPSSTRNALGRCRCTR